MSSRALKRLERQKLTEMAGGPTENTPEPEESSEDESRRPDPKFNAFALLNGDDEEEVSEEEREEVKSNEEPKVIASPPSTSSSSKGKKSKKSKKSKAPEPVDSDEELDRILAEAKARDIKNELSSTSNAHDGDIDEEVYDFEEEMDLEPVPIKDFDSNFKFFTSNRLKQSFPLLSVESIKDLDPDQEFRNLFGNLSLETIEDANTTTSLAISPEMLQQFKKLARLTRGWGGKDRKGVPGSTRKLLLTRIRDDWLPTAQKPLDMKELKQEEVFEYMNYKEDSALEEELEFKIRKEFALGVRYFKFEKIKNIQQRVANTRFYAAVVMTPDPESLMQLLQQFPYHAETLLQVAMVLLRQGSEKSTSNSLIEKALFVFDRTFQKKFHELLLEGKSELIRLPYESFMNRQFYICLFRYIIGLGERRTFFTAFSYCKLLLALSPAEDPVGVRYFIDFYAIMSEEYSYLTKFAQSPLVTTYEKWLTPGIAYSTVLAHLHLGDEENARKSLKLAYTKHPYTALKLLELIGLASKLPVKESDLNPSHDVLVASETYLVRAALLWNEQSKRQFLHDELTKLFQVQPQKTSSGLYNLLGLNSSKLPESDISLNLIRFTILSGESKIMARLPQSVWNLDNTFEYDVLPPKDTTVQYNEFTGVSSTPSPVVDSLIDYVDHNLLGTIVQSRTHDDTQYEDLVRQLQAQAGENGEPVAEELD